MSLGGPSGYITFNIGNVSLKVQGHGHGVMSRSHTKTAYKIIGQKVHVCK